MNESTPNRTTASVQLQAVTRRFGPVIAVDDVSLTIGPGEVVALLGPNGAGKSTTIDMILGLSEPNIGAVQVFGMEPRRAVAVGMVAAVLQSGGLLNDFTVAETVRLTASLFRAARPVDEVLELAGLDAIRHRRVGKCSGGEQQRLRFALAMLPDPDLLILDEPTTGMDVEGRRDFWNTMREGTGQGRTVIFATHYLEEADAYADRIVMLRHGSVVADGTPAEIKALASGRTLRATLPGATLETLRSLPGVDAAELRGDAVIIHGRDTDATARYLLTRTQARDLEITSNNLEDAFVALTSDETDARATSSNRMQGVAA